MRVSISLKHPLCSINNQNPDTQVPLGAIKKIIPWSNKECDMFVSGGKDGMCHLWDIVGNHIKGFLCHHAWINDILLLSNSGDTNILTASCDASIKVWKMEQDDMVQLKHTLISHTDYVQCLSDMTGNDTFYSAGLDGHIITWKTDQDIQKGQIFDATSSIYALTTIPSHQLIVSGSSDHLIRIWDSRSLTLVSTLKGHSDIIRSFSVCNDLLFSGGSDGLLHAWDARQLHRPVHTFDSDIHHGNSIYSIQSDYSKEKDSFILYSSDRNGSIYQSTLPIAQDQPSPSKLLHRQTIGSISSTCLINDSLWIGIYDDLGSIYPHILKVSLDGDNIDSYKSCDNFPCPIVRSSFLHSKRKILSQDACGKCYITDILSRTSEMVTECNNTLDESHWEYVLDKYNSKYPGWAVSWAHIETNIGRIVITLEESSIFQAELFLDEDNLSMDPWKNMYQEKKSRFDHSDDKGQEPEDDGIRINIGQLFLISLYDTDCRNDESYCYSIEEYQNSTSLWRSITGIKAFGRMKSIPQDDDILPSWWVACVTKDKVISEFNKMNMVFWIKLDVINGKIDEKGSKLISLTEGQGQRLTAHPMVRFARLKDYIEQQLASLTDNGNIGNGKCIFFYCGSQSRKIFIEEKQTLGYVRQYYWRDIFQSQGDLQLTCTLE